MLQRGFSNRPTGAVALLLLGAAYLLNLARTHDHRNFLFKTMFGSPVKNTLVAVQKAGVTIDYMLLSWGKMLECESESLGGMKKEKLIVARTGIVKEPAYDSSSLMVWPGASVRATPRPPKCQKRNGL